MKEKNIIVAAIVILALSPIFTFAKTTDLPKPGLTPDSPFYFFDTLGEKIDLLFTFSPEKKAEKALQHAEEKLAEAQVMSEENKPKATDIANNNYQDSLNLANTKVQEAKDNGKDVEGLAVLITETTLKHQEILVEIFNNVPEEAKAAIEKAIQVSRNDSEEAVRAVSDGSQKDELLQKIEETKTRTEKEITSLKEKLEEKSAEAERLKKEVETAKEETEKAKAEVEKLRKETVVTNQGIPAIPAIPSSGGGGAVPATPAQSAQPNKPTQSATTTTVIPAIPTVPAQPAVPSSGDGGGVTPAIPATPATPAIPATPSDKTAPIISNTQFSNITQNSAKITWYTNEDSTSVVNYGLSVDSYNFTASGNTTASTAASFIHTVFLNDLISGTTYHYKVSSIDNNGNKAEGEGKIFTTIQDPINCNNLNSTSSCVILEDQDSSGAILSNNGFKGAFIYGFSSDKFNFSFTGRAPIANDWYALVIGEDPRNHPETAVILEYPRSDGNTGDITLSGNIELDRDLNNVQVLLVHASDIGTNGDYTRILNWNIWSPELYLFGSTLINYHDTSVVVQDDFNNYTNGTIVGQGSWNGYTGGNNFTVQGNIVLEGTKALYNNSSGDSVIYKKGTALSDGKQVFYIKTEDRNNWATSVEAQVRVMKGAWETTQNFIAVTFEKNGNVGYSIGGGARNYFATYNDNEWIKLEIEWRSIDKKARYKLNDGVWTNWDVFWGNVTDFDYVGIDFDKRQGTSGGVYFDNLY